MNGKTWEILSKTKDPTLKFKNEEILQILLKNRGIVTEKDKDTFLHPKLGEVTSQSIGINITQLKKAISRIKKAIKSKEQIIVFGDYDVDGITASAILWETLHDLSAIIMPYIPHRMDEGYGLSAKGIDNVLIKYPQTKLIITVDNGIVANTPVEYANKKGIDVIITDHHVAEDRETSKLPKACAIVHTTQLCGAGVAYVLSKEIENAFAKTSNPDVHLELATLGTIADLVPLTGANRTIVTYGLPVLRQTQRPGLKELYNEAGIAPSQVSTYEVGHMIAPRLNAMGRLEYAMESLRLICTKNTSRAQELAALLSKTNKERQEVTKTALEHAKLQVVGKQTLGKLLFIVHESYQQGIIGLIAGRLVEEYYRPAIVLSKGETHSKASARSIHGFNMIEFIRSAQEYIDEAGGHPMAAGFTVQNAKLEELQKVLEALAEKTLTNEHLVRVLKIDSALQLSQIDESFYETLQKLAPFGMGNPEPVFVTKNVGIESKRYVGKDMQHLKLQVFQDNSVVYEAIGFNMGELAANIKTGDKVDIVYTINENTWNNKTSLQLKLKDIKKNN